MRTTLRVTLILKRASSTTRRQKRWSRTKPRHWGFWKLWISKNFYPHSVFLNRHLAGLAHGNGRIRKSLIFLSIFNCVQNSIRKDRMKLLQVLKHMLIRRRRWCVNFKLADGCNCNKPATFKVWSARKARQIKKGPLVFVRFLTFPTRSWYNLVTFIHYQKFGHASGENN